MKILVVEDDLLVADALRSTLSSHNYAVEVANDGRAALDCIEAFKYDLLLLDVILPKLDGISLCRHIRSQGYMMPILLLTSRDSKHDRAVGLDAGADDYVIKPFDPEELSARIRALLRRGNDNVQPILTWKDLTLDPRNCEVTYQDRVLTLTPKEYALLELFLRHNRRLFSCGAILEHLWTYEDAPSEEAVRTHIKGLRQKLKGVGAPHNLVETVYGIGYRLKSFDQIPLQQDITLGEISVSKQERWLVPASEDIATAGANQIVTTSPQVAPANSPPPAQLPNSTPIPRSSDLKTAQPNSDRVRATTSTPSMLVEIWNRHYAQMSERVETIERAITALESQSLSDQARLQAWQSAHTLAGALGTFGLPLGSQAAKQIELLLDAKTELTLAQFPQLQTKVIELRQEISSKRVVSEPEIAPPPPPIGAAATQKERLLVITKEAALASSLHDVGASKFEILTMTELAPDCCNPVPKAIVLDLDCFAHSTDWLRALSALDLDYPSVPILVLSHPASSTELPSGGSIDPLDPSPQLRQRVEVARRGGRMFLSKPIAAEEILQAIERVLHPVTVKQARIAIVDDDLILLEGLTALLSRANMMVTTLSEPSRFWETLEAAKPDLLILDLDMPTYNGIELCRAVRTDPQWATLPIMFLTAHSATIAIDRVFAAGADDFVTKPAIASELVTRILNRLDRIAQRAISK
jgi:DNA-binding response OmpR family regulator/HPt (histidine-containing phosphotransfer) domain-containing protein